MSKERRKYLIASSLFDGIEDSRMRYVLVILQDEDADPNYLLHDRGIAPIHMAIGHESKDFALEVTSVLLQYGANPNVCSAEGMTPVHIAAAWGRSRLLRLLLANGGNPWLEDDDGKNAFHLAFEEGHHGASQLLEDFRLKDRAKFDDWTELCDPNPKFTIALDKVLLYNREVLLSYQTSSPFASRDRREIATQTTPPASPPEAPPPKAGPLAASTTALDRFSFVLSDIRNKVVSQVTLRKVSQRPLFRRPAMPPAPRERLSFLDELRQRQAAGLRHAAKQVALPGEPETRLVRDEVMVRVTASPVASGDDSRGSDGFESRLDRAFRHLEADNPILSDGAESPVEWAGLPSGKEAELGELSLDLRALGDGDEAAAPGNHIPYGASDRSFGVNHTSFGTNYVTANDASLGARLSSRADGGTPGGVSSGMDQAESVSQAIFVDSICDSVPNGINNARFQENNGSFGSNQAISVQDNSDCIPNEMNNAPSKERNDLFGWNRVTCAKDSTDSVPNEAPFRESNESCDLNCAMFVENDSDSVPNGINKAHFQENNGSFGSNHSVFAKDNADRIPHGMNSSPFQEHNQSFGPSRVQFVDSNSYSVPNGMNDPPSQEHNPSFGWNHSVFAKDNADSIPHGMNDPPSQEHNQSFGWNRALLDAAIGVVHDDRCSPDMFEGSASSDAPPNSLAHESLDDAASRHVDGTAAGRDFPREGCAAPTNSTANSTRGASLSMLTARSELSPGGLGVRETEGCAIEAGTNNASAIEESAIEGDIQNKARVTESCVAESSSGNCQEAVSRELGCSVVWESALDASDSFRSCRDRSQPLPWVGTEASRQPSLSQPSQEVVAHSFASLAEAASTEFISEDEECFDSESHGNGDNGDNAHGNAIEGVPSGEIRNARSGLDGEEPAAAGAKRSSDSLVSASEEYVYTDEEEGVVLVERRFLVPPANEGPPSSDSDGSDWPGQAAVDGYDTDRLRADLVRLGVQPGPIVPGTKRVYLKKLQRAARGDKAGDPDRTAHGYSCELDRSLRDDAWSSNLAEYEALEVEMSAPFASPDPRKCWRGGAVKSSFCYLLLDPRVTANLPRRAASMPASQAWATFLEAVFYVGKGKRSRPYSHLYQAVSVWRSGRRRAADAKTQHILDVWSAGLGVVCLHVFQNAIPAEALTREAAMLDALTLARVRNRQRSEYHGVAAVWGARQRRMLGTLLLHKAMRIFISEGERQLRPGDIGH